MSKTTAIALWEPSRGETQSASFTVSLTTNASPAQSSVVPRGRRFGRGNTLRAIPVMTGDAQYESVLDHSRISLSLFCRRRANCWTVLR